MLTQNTPALETGRLILRKFTENDIEAVLAIYGDEEVNAFLPWFPLKSLKEAEHFFREKYAESYRQPTGYRYAVCLKTDNIPIGYVHVSPDDSCDFGYALRKGFQRKGIATEAGRAVLEQLKRDGFQYITATHDVHNPRSGNVMKRLGMSYKYTYREIWQPKNFEVTFRMYQLNFDGCRERTYRKYQDMYETHFIESGV